MLLESAMIPCSTHIVRSYDEDLKYLRATHRGDGRPCRAHGRPGGARAGQCRRRPGAQGDRRRCFARRGAARDRRQGDHHDRASASRWRTTCARSSARSASRPTSSASATSARTSPSASSPSTDGPPAAQPVPRAAGAGRARADAAQGSARRLCVALGRAARLHARPRRPDRRACTRRCSANSSPT